MVQVPERGERVHGAEVRASTSLAVSGRRVGLVHLREELQEARVLHLRASVRSLHTKLEDSCNIPCIVQSANSCVTVEFNDGSQ